MAVKITSRKKIKDLGGAAPAPAAERDYGQLEAKHRPYDKDKYTVYVKQSSRILYWLALLLLVIFNFLTFLPLIPLAVFMTGDQRHAIVAVIGLLFGLIFNFLITDIEHLEPRHHLFAGLVIPIVAALNLFIMTVMVNFLRSVWELPQAGGAFTESLVYAFFFLGPYLYSLFTGRFSRGKVDSLRS